MKNRLPPLAKMIDHSLLHPTLSDEALLQGLGVAKKYEVACVFVKPYAVALTAKELTGSGVGVGTVAGFPHGGNRIETKVEEIRLACEDGATEIDVVLNLGKVMGGDWDYLRREAGLLVDETHKRGAILKVIFENDFLPDDEIKIKLCRISEDAGADFVKTSTGFGFVQGPDGKYSYRGATDHDLQLMRRTCSSRVQVKAAGGIRTLEDALRVRDLGVTRIGATATEAILTEARKRGIK